MLNAIIVEDEPKNRKILKELLLEFCPEVQIIGEAVNADDAVSKIEKSKPDLVFLDIEMPFGNAFDVLDRLKPVDFEIIFVTAFDDYTLKAFRYSALDYLLKPVNIDELKAAVAKANAKVDLKNLNLRLGNLMFNVNKGSETAARIAIPSNDGFEIIPIDKIIRFEAKRSYTNVYTSDNRKHVSSRNIKAYEDILPPQIFFRIHHSHLINLSFIKKYHKGRGGEIEMQDGTMIEVATRRKNEFLSLFRHGT